MIEDYQKKITNIVALALDTHMPDYEEDKPREEKPREEKKLREEKPIVEKPKPAPIVPVKKPPITNPTPPALPVQPPGGII